jgi:hypothetical protein
MQNEPTLNPPMPFEIRPYSDVGSGEPFLARLMLGLLDILDATMYPKRIEIKEAIAAITMDCVLPAFLSLRELRKIADDRNAPVVSKQKHFDDMCKSLWSAYKDRTRTAAELMGYDIRFLCKEGPVFEFGCKEFQTAHPEVNEELIRRMKHNRSTWQSHLVRFRNDYLEHKKLTQQDVVAMYSLLQAESFFLNVWVAIEEILVMLLAAGLPPHAGLREIPEPNRDPHAPKRFGFAWIPPRAT